MKKEILRILRSSQGYVSGQELCEALGVSRTAVWKVMKQLKEEGYEIDAVSKKGYQLLGKPDILSKEELESLMETEVFGRKVEFFEEIDSTNTYAKKFAENPGSHGTLVVADCQKQGKGRRGRHWESEKGSGIWMTLILKPGIPPESASPLTLVAGLSISNAIAKTLGIANYIKWPNDIVVEGKKVCGILTEMSTEFDYINHVVIGMGINVNETSFPKELKEKAASLSERSSVPIGRAELIAAIMKELEHNYALFLKTQDLSLLCEEFNEKLVSRNKEVAIIEGERRTEAVALGINEKGELHIRTKAGEEKHIFAGEVSVRGIYGYV